jgi:hypothetical protein
VTASSALTASYISSSNIDGNVPVADFIPVRLASEDQWFKIAFTDELYSDDPAGLFKESDNTSLQYNPSLQRLIIGNISASNFTGSLSGTASYATTSSYALTASYALNGGGGSTFPYTGNAQIIGNLDVDGVISSNGGVNSQITMYGLNSDQEFDILFSEASTNGGLSYPYYDSTNQTFTFNPFKNQLTVVGTINHGFLNDVASGTFSYAQGFGNIIQATANFSHAQGVNTLVVGQGSHTEGESNKAIGDYSHAEGFSNIASGSWSHAEGYSTIASGSYSHTEGSGTVTSGSYSHAEGYQTKTIGNYTHAEGRSTIASGSYSHAEGYGTKTIGQYAHAEGVNTIASGTGSHAEGRFTTASGDYSYAAGVGTTTNAPYQFAVGSYNNPTGVYQFSVGNGSEGLPSNVFQAGGNYASVNGQFEVYGDIASGYGTIVLGDLVGVEYLNDAAAAAAGIPVGGLYRNGSFIQIRLV